MTFAYFRKLIYVLGLAFMFGQLAQCTDSNFGGTAKSKRPGGGADKGGDDDDDDDDDNNNDPDLDPGVYYDGTPEDEDDPVRIFDDEFKGHFRVNTLNPEQRNFFWTATTNGVARYHKIEGTKVVETKEWTGLKTSTGFRTYVLEGGSAVITGTGGHFHWIDPEGTPQGALPQVSPNYHKESMGGGDRSCVVSYRRDKKRYVGVGFGSGQFKEFELENKAPYTPKWAAATRTGNVAVANWGYSCYIDQEDLIYYSAFVVEPPTAMDLKTLASTGGKSIKGPPGGHSYAISGDKSGNPLGGNNVYTMTYEEKSDTIWTTGRSGGTLTVSPSECVIKNTNCGKEAQFNTVTLGANVRPVSALGDGKVIGLVRSGGSSSAYLMSLKDEKDISAGVNITRIAELNGDPYMYTDFTGATLYMTDSVNTFEFSSAEAKKSHPAIGFAYEVRKTAKSKEWKDLKLEVRCYVEGKDEGDWETVKSVKDAGKMTFIQTPSCKDQKYSAVDIRISQEDDGDTLMDIAKVQVTLY